ncbi:uncharacterized protein LOC107263915 [Cephus cinctus]|uniref:Uncharacterized protein LOC107263915 n=1 Tax=Cephus cinctus TaxID=211228 RepID=A0AAJ7BIS3_CEPCN|nr:uncharacterized protein LOC107263915 [Cephus cinctus]
MPDHQLLELAPRSRPADFSPNRLFQCLWTTWNHLDTKTQGPATPNHSTDHTWVHWNDRFAHRYARLRDRDILNLSIGVDDIRLPNGSRIERSQDHRWLRYDATE